MVLGCMTVGTLKFGSFELFELLIPREHCFWLEALEKAPKME